MQLKKLVFKEEFILLEKNKSTLDPFKEEKEEDIERIKITT